MIADLFEMMGLPIRSVARAAACVLVVIAWAKPAWFIDGAMEFGRRQTQSILERLPVPTDSAVTPPNR